MYRRTAAALLTSVAAPLAISSGIAPSSASIAKTWTVTLGEDAVAITPRQVITSP